MILALLACQGEPGHTGVATADTTLAACAPYADLPEVQGVCLIERVNVLRDVADVHRVCSSAGAWEKECRHTWVSEQVRMQHDVPRSVLLSACGPSEDCAFQILDTQAEGDVNSQLRLCETRVSSYLDDCVGHTLERWVLERKPDLVEGQRVIDAEPAYAEAVGRALGRASACQKTFACAPTTDVAWTACRTAAAELATDPRRCQTRPPAGATLPR